MKKDDRQGDIFAASDPMLAVEKVLALEVAIILAPHLVLPDGTPVRPTAEELGRKVASLARKRFLKKDT